MILLITIYELFQSEIDQVLSMGVEPSKIIFANPIKSVYMLNYARERGVKYMTFDSEAELDKIAKHYPEAKIVMRLKVSDEGAEFHLGNKFGVFEQDHEKVLKKANDLKLHVAGIAFHVGSNQREPNAYKMAIEMARKVFDLSQKLGMKRFNLLDIGGGYPGDVDFDNENDLFYNMSNTINAALDEFFPKSEFKDLKIISGKKLNQTYNLLIQLSFVEPGRYFPTTAFALVMKVIGKKVVEVKGKMNTFYYINDGIYQSFLIHILEPEQLKKLQPFLVKDDVTKREKKLSTIWGQTCADKDYLVKNVMFPDIEIGEHIIVKQYGAYTYTFRSEFNGFPKPYVKYVISDKNKKYLED